jgi:MFS family permease
VRSFAVVAASMLLFMVAAGAPTPLYVVYQRAWGFSDTTLTVVFAIYVLALLTSVLVIGSLSDHVGRRPMLIGAILLESISLVLFVLAGDVTALVVARILQGAATGVAMTTLGAALVDLEPDGRPGLAGLANGVAPPAGLALGALGCGALVEWAPQPRHLVYLVLLACMLAALAGILRLPESSPRTPGARASLAPRVGLPRHARPQLLALLPIFLASWALGGLFLSLGPSVAVGIFGRASHFEGGVVVALLCATGAATSFVLRSVAAATLAGPAAALLALGTVIALAGVDRDSISLAIAGTLVAGVGFGASALACFGTLARVALPAERGELFALAYLVSYTAFSAPAVLAGFASTEWGLRGTTLVYGAGIAALSAVAVAGQRVAGTASA